ncbi:hypothetical protein CKO09_03725 [Chromatium weissei]|nr:hypothetical protein [Chromatium weissei]
MPLIDYDAANFPGIKILDPEGASTFALSCKEALNEIISQPLGLRLLREISDHAPMYLPWGGSIKIYRAEKPIDQGGSRATAVSEGNAQNGTGSASGVSWNSNVFAIPGQGPRPPFIGLAHELIHAWHNARGTKKASYDDEENFTVGLGLYMIPSANSITENMIRLEHGVGIRHFY